MSENMEAGVRPDAAGGPGPNIPMPRPMGEAAFHGPAGLVIEALLPFCEADAHALLLHTLVLFGSRVGRAAEHRIPGGKAIYVNEYAAIAGVSGDARKSTAADAVLTLWGAVEPDFEASAGHCQGLGSGEALIARVRDASIDADGRVDRGVEDKRVMLHLDEFGLLFAAMSRDGSVLGDILKIAYGGSVLQSAIKNHSQRATGAHVCLAASTTVGQLHEALAGRKLRGRLSDGFANRILWVLAERSKRLPRLGRAEEQAAEAARGEAAGVLRQALEWVSENRPVLTWDREAGEAWDRWYNELEIPARLAGILGRAEVHVLKCAMLYSLLDRSPVLRLEHLQAGLEIWRFCRESATGIFEPLLEAKLVGSGGRSSLSSGRSGVGRGEDRLLAYLRNHGSATRNLILRTVFARNKSSAEIDVILQSLVAQNLVRITQDRSTHPATETIYLAGETGIRPIRPDDGNAFETAPYARADTRAGVSRVTDDDWADITLDPQ
jgi:hypothetical protein